MKSNEFNLKDNLIKLLEWLMQTGPYRCPQTGSSINKKNGFWILKMQILFAFCGLASFHFADWLKYI
jgi:hypothetical protein